MKSGLARASFKNNSCVFRARLRPKMVSVAVAACFSANLSHANPTNPVVVNGAASFTQTGNLLSIANTPNAIINWGSFSIGASEITRFIQQSNASSVLNRVGPGGDPSVILGQLQSILSNGITGGRVFLINPNGITFGAGSQINVGGLVASTLNLSDADFLAGRMRFSDGLGKTLLNQGNITTNQGGSVYLIGNAITNNGIITSPKGEVVLAAGNSVELVNPGTPDLRVEIAAPDNQAINLGQITAEAGRIGIYAGLINHSGAMNANSVQVGENGQIVLKATKNITIEAGSTTTANGPTGGKIDIRSGDTTLVSGAIEATGAVGEGGVINVLGNLVGITGNANLNTSGDTGGGSVLIGGDFQGKNTNIPNAFRTYVGSDTTIKADAVTSGDGGKVVVWSDDATHYYGSISAKGGAAAGNGGLVEVSGKGHLDFNGFVNTTAPNGNTGMLLLDPTTIFIANNQVNATTFGMLGTDTSVDSSGLLLFTASGVPTDSLLLTSTLTSALASNSVVISTASAATGLGNIGVVDPISWSSANSLTLLAQNKIISRAITNSGSGDINMYAGWDGVSTVTPVVTAGASKDILITADVKTGGNILLKAGNDITVQPSLATFGSPSSGSITSLIVSASGSFIANAGNNFTVQGNTVAATASSGTPTVVSDAAATITANSINITASGVLTIAGGDALSASANGTSVSEIFSATASSDARLTATNDISLTGNAILIRGGDFPSTGTTVQAKLNAGNGSAAVHANAALSAGGNITMSAAGAGGITIRGGTNANAKASHNDGVGARGSALVDANTTVTAGGNVTLSAGANSINISGGNNLLASATRSTGDISDAVAEGNVAVTAGGALNITAGSLSVRGGGNARASATNSNAGFNRATTNANVTVLADSAAIVVAGPVTIQGGSNASAITRGSDGLGRFESRASAIAKVQGTNNVSLAVTTGDLTVAGGDNARANGTEAAGQHTLVANAGAELSAGGALTVNVNNGNLTVRGGDNANINISGSAGTGPNNLQAAMNVNALVSGGSSVTFNTSNALLIRAGNSARVSNFNNGSGGANAVLETTASATAGTTLSITAGSLTVQGGNNASADARRNGSETATVFANASATANNVNITVSGPLNISGGVFANASGSASNNVGAKAIGVVNANAQVHAFNTLSVAVNSGDLTIVGGDNANAAGDFVFRTSSATVNSNADLSSGGNASITVAAGNLTVRGGDGVRTSANAAGSPGAVVTSQLNAKGSVQATGSLGLSVSGLLNVRGGNSAQAIAEANFNPSSQATSSADVSASLTSGGALTIGAGSLSVRGGTTPTVSASGSGLAVATLVNKALVSAGGILTAQASNAIDVGAAPAAPSSGVLTGGGALIGSNLTLIANAMDIQGPVTAGGGTGSIDIQTATPGRTIDLGSGGPSSTALELSNGELANLQTASLSFTGSPIINSATITTAPTIAVTFNAPGQDITLSAANDFQGTVSLVANNASITDANALTFGTLNISSFLGVSASGLLNLGTGTINAGSLTGNGGVTQSGPLTINGAVGINGGGNPITLTQSNNILGSVILNGGGVTQLTSSGTLTLLNANLGNTTLNAPAINVQGTVVASFYTLPAGTLTVQSGGMLNVANDTNIGSGAVLATNGGTFNSGTITVNGLLQGSATGPINASQTVTVFPSGALFLNGGTVTATSVDLAGGLLKGSGTVSGNVNNNGIVSPGNSPGLISINGDYVQGAGGVLNVEIGGLAPATQYDQLIVSGNATLNGLLNTTLINGFLPISDTFSIIKTLGTTAGTFTLTSIPATANLAVKYLNNGVDIFLTPGSITNTLVNTVLLPATDLIPTGMLQNKDIFPSADESQEILKALGDGGTKPPPVCN